MTDSGKAGQMADAGVGPDEHELVELFARHRDRLRKMVQVRLDRRLQGRVDPSDVLQEAQLDVLRRAAGVRRQPDDVSLPLAALPHRPAADDPPPAPPGCTDAPAGQEVSLYRGALPQATSVSLAALLLGRLTSPTQAAQRAEMKIRLQEALNSMDPIDREILTLRHFEELGNSETAEVLGIGKTAACNRYLRALKRLREILSAIPGFLDT